MTLPCLAKSFPGGRRVAAFGLAAVVLAAGSPAQAAGCPSLCMEPTSVKNAAGIDPKLLLGLTFKAGEATTSAAAIERVARAWKAAGGKGVLQLTVLADRGIQPAAAKKLAAARAAALADALVGAGIPTANVKVAGRP